MAQPILTVFFTQIKKKSMLNFLFNLLILASKLSKNLLNDLFDYLLHKVIFICSKETNYKFKNVCALQPDN